MPIEKGSGGLTKFNRASQNLPKTHYIDAACVGISTPLLKLDKVQVLEIKATGQGTRQMCKVDKIGFPRTSAKTAKKFFGFQTGDIVKAIVTSGKKVGTYIGKVAVRATGFFAIITTSGKVDSIKHNFCKLLFACDGYSYSYSISNGNSSTA